MSPQSALPDVEAQILAKHNRLLEQRNTINPDPGAEVVEEVEEVEVRETEVEVVMEHAKTKIGLEANAQLTSLVWSTTQTGGSDKGTRSQGCRSSAVFLWSRGLSLFLWYYWLDAMCGSGFLLSGTGTHAIRDCAYSDTGNESPFA